MFKIGSMLVLFKFDQDRVETGNLNRPNVVRLVCTGYRKGAFINRSVLNNNRPSERALTLEEMGNRRPNRKTVVSLYCFFFC